MAPFSERRPWRSALHVPIGSAGAAGRQVVRHLVEVDELMSELREPLDVGTVRGYAQRCADGTARGQSDRLDVVVERHPFAELTADQRLAGESERDLAGAGVAEAAGAQ